MRHSSISTIESDTSRPTITSDIYRPRKRSTVQSLKSILTDRSRISRVSFDYADKTINPDGLRASDLTSEGLLKYKSRYSFAPAALIEKDPKSQKVVFDEDNLQSNWSNLRKDYTPPKLPQQRTPVTTRPSIDFFDEDYIEYLLMNKLREERRKTRDDSIRLSRKSSEKRETYSSSSESQLSVFLKFREDCKRFNLNEAWLSKQKHMSQYMHPALPPISDSRQHRMTTTSIPFDLTVVGSEVFVKRKNVASHARRFWDD